MTRDKLINWLTRRTADESQLEAADMLQRDGKELERLRAELETERMRLVACSVIALANTPESAASARGIHPDYRSASCDDVARAVDREIALRAELAECKRDAERYRWLRSESCPWPGVFSIEGADDYGWDAICEGDLDQAIDDALAAKEE